MTVREHCARVKFDYTLIDRFVPNNKFKRIFPHDCSSGAVAENGDDLSEFYHRLEKVCCNLWKKAAGMNNQKLPEKDPTKIIKKKKRPVLGQAVPKKEKKKRDVEEDEADIDMEEPCEDGEQIEQEDSVEEEEQETQREMDPEDKQPDSTAAIVIEDTKTETAASSAAAEAKEAARKERAERIAAITNRLT